MMHLKKMLHAMPVLVGILFHESVLHAAFEYPGLGWSAASANIKVLGSSNPDRLLVNPALLIDNGSLRFSFQYHKPYQGLGLQAGSLSSVYRLGRRPFVSGIQYFGDDVYSEWKLSSGSAWALNRGVKAGLNLNFQNLRVAGFTNRSAVSLSTSMVLEIGGGVRIGTLLEHIIQLQKHLPIPQKFHFGTDYRSGPINIIFALEKESALPMELCLGMVFSPGSLWEFGLGYRDLSQSFSAGWRLKLPKLTLNYICVVYPELPLSHGFGLELSIR